jgi:hypothetical protein
MAEPKFKCEACIGNGAHTACEIVANVEGAVIPHNCPWETGDTKAVWQEVSEVVE